jgi:hypothetical protein
MTSDEELLEVVVECWHDRAETYRRLGYVDAAKYVETCAHEVESLVLEANHTADIDSEIGDD